MIQPRVVEVVLASAYISVAMLVVGLLVGAAMHGTTVGARVLAVLEACLVAISIVCIAFTLKG